MSETYRKIKEEYIRDLRNYEGILKKYQRVLDFYHRLENSEVDRSLLIQSDINLQEAGNLLEEKLKKLRKRKNNIDRIEEGEITEKLYLRL